MIIQSSKGFFQVGGALDPDAPSYVTRQADDDLLRVVLSGQYCNVLTARQMGKSSLMVRTVRRLQEEGVRTVTIDLTGLGTELGASEWYFGLVSRFKRQLGLSVDEKDWWIERDQLGPVQRFSDFLRQVVLEEVKESIVVFVDEIDSTLSLPFTDDFFAAIRAAYNARASDPAYKRITFVLLGVARPSDLIKDRTRTPYNIGTSIDLKDFTPQEARVLLAGLKTSHPEQADSILTPILHWTGGHPYLTQKVCAEVQSVDGHWTDEQIDDLVEQLFLTEEARKETNLQFIRDRIQECRERGGMLRVYCRVWAGKRVQDEERSVVKSQLKLTGLVKPASDGVLVVRNPIYERVFDRQWVKENMPVSPAQRVAIGASVVAALALIVVVALIYRQQTVADEVRAELFTTNFLTATSPEVRLDNLAGLFGLDGYEEKARDLFFNLATDDQVALFEGLGNPEQVGSDVLVVVDGVYQDQRLENREEHNQLLRAMAGVLHQVEGQDVPGAEATAMEIDYWVEGREQAEEGNYAAAVEQYTLALGLNEENASLIFDRGKAYSVLGKYQAASFDLRRYIELYETETDWQRGVEYWIKGLEYAAEENFADAVNQYNLALDLSGENTIVLLDRGRANVAMGEYRNASIDFQEAIKSREIWGETVQQILGQDTAFYIYLLRNYQRFPDLIDWYPHNAPIVGSVRLSDDFDGGWAQLNWSRGVGGAVRVESDRLKVSAEPWERTSRHWKTIVISASGADKAYTCEECIIQVEVEIPEADLPRGAGIVFGFNSVTDFYEFVVAGYDNIYNSWALVKGGLDRSSVFFLRYYEAWTQLSPVSKSFDLRIDIYAQHWRTDGSYRAYFYVNDVRVGSQLLSEYTGGGVGLVTVTSLNKSGTVLFDNFRVSEILEN